jgi:hypothetical protein
MRYKCWRSVEPRLHLLCLEDGFDALPDKIRQLGPWMGTHEGNVDQLKLHYRLLMTEQQFVDRLRATVKRSALALDPRSNTSAANSTS